MWRGRGNNIFFFHCPYLPDWNGRTASKPRSPHTYGHSESLEHLVRHAKPVGPIVEAKRLNSKKLPHLENHVKSVSKKKKVKSLPGKCQRTKTLFSSPWCRSSSLSRCSRCALAACQHATRASCSSCRRISTTSPLRHKTRWAGERPASPAECPNWNKWTWPQLSPTASNRPEEAKRKILGSWWTDTLEVRRFSSTSCAMSKKVRKPVRISWTTMRELSPLVATWAGGRKSLATRPAWDKRFAFPDTGECTRRSSSRCRRWKSWPTAIQDKPLLWRRTSQQSCATPGVPRFHMQQIEPALVWLRFTKPALATEIEENTHPRGYSDSGYI